MIPWSLLLAKVWPVLLLVFGFVAVVYLVLAIANRFKGMK